MKEISNWQLLIKTLKKRNGDLDYRKLTAFSSYFLGSICAIYVVASDLFLKKEINPYAIGIVGLFFSMATGQVYFSMRNKKLENQINNDTENNQQ